MIRAALPTALTLRLYGLYVRALPLIGGLLAGCSYGEPARQAPPPQVFGRPPIAAPAAPAARIALGKALFHDARLSGDGRMSCATCHRPDRGYADGEVRSRGAGGRLLPRHTPGLWNIGLAPDLFVDGRADTLETQALAPVYNPAEMARPKGTLVAALVGDPALRAAFARAFPEAPVISEASVAAALAAFQRSLVSGPAPFDRWAAGQGAAGQGAAGQGAALSPAAARGYALFAGKAGCARCHRGWAFSDGRFHDIGLGSDDVGRAAVTGRPSDRFKFRTPSLREVGRTAPYMHDGSLPTLAAVVDHYADTARRPRRNALRPVALTAAERTDLVVFLGSLDSDVAADGAGAVIAANGADAVTADVRLPSWSPSSRR